MADKVYLQLDGFVVQADGSAFPEDDEGQYLIVEKLVEALEGVGLAYGGACNFLTEEEEELQRQKAEQA